MGNQTSHQDSHKYEILFQGEEVTLERSHDGRLFAHSQLSGMDIFTPLHGNAAELAMEMCAKIVDLITVTFEQEF